MLPNTVPLWELLLAAMKLGAVVIPSTTQLTRDDLEDRVARGGVKLVATDAAGAEKWDGVPGAFAGLLCGDRREGWHAYDDARGEAPISACADTRATDPLLLYFTSGTTAKPKLVEHTQQSYPVGHLSTMYWIGLREGDVHWNISSPGWAKHAWSTFFAPWNAGATIFVREAARFQPRAALEAIVKHEVTTLCAPPTVWRMLTLEDLASYAVKLREVVGAGEPLNPEVVERVMRAWGLVLRDGYGQTETTAQIGNSPGQIVRPGSMGRPLPGYEVALLDPDGNEAAEGELSLRLDPRPTGLMAGYRDDPDLTARAFGSGYYRTGDVATRDEAGYFHYVGRSDDVFKSSDYRISPFELESVLIEHEAVAEAAVVESPDPVRLCVPKAFVVLRPGVAPSRELAADLFRFVRDKLAPFKRVRRIEFAELPKTISGKIRRVELRRGEKEHRAHDERAPNEYFIEDFAEPK
jgi:acetyl-CoA synthetase